MTSLATERRITVGELFAGTDVSFGEEIRELSVVDITTNSRRAVAGGAFLACAGQSSHGLEYVRDAIEAGTIFVAWEPDGNTDAPDLPGNVVGIPVPGLGDMLGALAEGETP